MSRKNTKTVSSDEENERPIKPVKYVSQFYTDSEEEESPKRKKKLTESDEEMLDAIQKRNGEPSKRKSKKSESPKKSQKKSSKREESDDEKPSNKRKMEESEEEEEDPFKVDKERLKKAENEILTSEEMKERTAKELEKKYKACLAYVKWYQKENKKAKKDNIPLWEQASQLMTDAAATLAKYRGLEKAEIKPDSHLNNAIPKLREKGENQYKSAMEIVEKLSPEDTQKFWADQERNQLAKSFEDLITKKEHEKRVLIASLPSTPIPSVIEKLNSIETNMDE